ncbi:hypothetical protein UB46_40210 [Burkholderiaceae bacterium 16]|nr:hypothetical protein UB46_40210 [Burkholderiaceae bacterium 16]
MTTIWTITADSSRARIFQAHGTGNDFHEIQDFINPLGRARDGELRQDAQGRYAGKGEPGHSVPPRTDPIEREHDAFARMLGQFLEQAGQEHRYDKLRLAAAPKFLGKLREHLGKAAQKAVFEEFDENISKLKPLEIQRRLNKS